MPTNVKENSFESSIVSWLVQHNGYEQGSNADYNKEKSRWMKHVCFVF